MCFAPSTLGAGLGAWTVLGAKHTSPPDAAPFDCDFVFSVPAAADATPGPDHDSNYAGVGRCPCIVLHRVQRIEIVVLLNAPTLSTSDVRQELVDLPHQPFPPVHVAVGAVVFVELDVQGKLQRPHAPMGSQQSCQPTVKLYVLITPSMDFSSEKGVVRGRRGQQLGFTLMLEHDKGSEVHAT